MDLLCKDLWRQLSGNIYYGVDMESKITPECSTPIRRVSKHIEAPILTDSEKLEVVLNDPRFGMLSLFRYHITRGRENAPCKRNNTAYCSHLFSRWCALPILVLFSQWGMYLALVLYHARTYEGSWCPAHSEFEHKILYASVCLLYFVKSFHAWDAMVQRSVADRVAPSNSVIVLLDAIIEFGFILIVWMTNLYIVYIEDSMTDAFLNSMALEFVMDLDNEFEKVYLELVPGAAADIYDHVFVSYDEQRTSLLRPQTRCIRCVINVFYTILQIGYIMFPIACLVLGIVGSICK